MCTFSRRVLYTRILAKFFALLTLMLQHCTVILNRSTHLLQPQPPFCHRRIQLLIQFTRLHSLNDRLNDLGQLIQRADFDGALAISNSLGLVAITQRQHHLAIFIIPPPTAQLLLDLNTFGFTSLAVRHEFEAGLGDQFPFQIRFNMRIPEHPVAHSNNIRSGIPGYPVTLA